MGVDGVTPGVAYTLLSNKSPQDRSFSVDLVKLLRDSHQESSISSQLTTMAQSDPRWNIVMNRADKKSATRYQGIGSGAARQSMTSSMLANQSSIGSSIGGFGDDGMKRAFAKIMGETSEGERRAKNPLESIPTQEPKKRKSRFAGLFQDPNPNDPTQVSPVIAPPPSTPLPGFVRASGSNLSSVSSSTQANSSSKKSRWG